MSREVVIIGSVVVVMGLLTIFAPEIKKAVGITK
jgi:hypothetical protein